MKNIYIVIGIVFYEDTFVIEGCYLLKEKQLNIV